MGNGLGGADDSLESAKATKFDSALIDQVVTDVAEQETDEAEGFVLGHVEVFRELTSQLFLGASVLGSHSLSPVRACLCAAFISFSGNSRLDRRLFHLPLIQASIRWRCPFGE